MTKLFCALIFIFASCSLEARVEIAFLEAWTANGTKVELERGDRFAHVAIKHNGLWLHSSPRNGTELVSDFNLFAKDEITEILSDERTPELSDEQVQALLGIPYDFKFRWEDDYGTYCSKLIGKLLNVPPSPMKFDGTYFRGIKNLPVGEPGLSPDGLYKALLKRGYVKSHRIHDFHRRK